MDRRRAASSLLALAICISCSVAAPTANSNQTALDVYDGSSEGCYYNFQYYSEGDRIMTNEPCLNCTCHNRMLMCYLRVCPFTKPIGQDCTVEKRADQCCPIVTCPDVPVDLLTSTSTTSPAEYGNTGLGKVDKYGCEINGKYFPEGAKVQSSPNKPCEHCYCIRNMTTCVMQECTLHVEGCTPIYHKDVCCPVRYSCDHPEDEIPLLDDMTTTVRPTPGFLLTTTTLAPVTQSSQECVHDDKIFPDGALIKTEKACEHCYCMKGDIVCVVQECGTPMENEGKNCTSVAPREGQCCPDTYICEGDDQTTEIPADRIGSNEQKEATTTPPRRVGSAEGSGYRNEDENPTVEPEVEGSGEEPIIDFTTKTEAPEKETEIIDDGFLITKTPHYSSTATVTENPEVTSEPDKGLNTVPDGASHEDFTESTFINRTPVNKESDLTTIAPQISEKQTTTEQIQTTTPPLEESALTQSTKGVSEIENIATESSITTVKLESDLGVTYKASTETSTINVIENEIDEEINMAPPAGRIPGEGDCLVNGITYNNESSVPSTNKCHSSCKCISSIIKCEPILCSPPPEYMDNCEPIYDSSEACCPTYICDHSKETIPPQPHSQMTETETSTLAPECAGDECQVSVEQPSRCSGTDCQVTTKETSLLPQECSGNECKSSEETPKPSECSGDECKIAAKVPLETAPEKEPATITEPPMQAANECNGDICGEEEKQQSTTLKSSEHTETLDKKPSQLTTPASPVEMPNEQVTITEPTNTESKQPVTTTSTELPDKQTTEILPSTTELSQPAEMPNKETSATIESSITTKSPISECSGEDCKFTESEPSRTSEPLEPTQTPKVEPAVVAQSAVSSGECNGDDCKNVIQEPSTSSESTEITKSPVPETTTPARISSSDCSGSECLAIDKEIVPATEPSKPAHLPEENPDITESTVPAGTTELSEAAETSTKKPSDITESLIYGCSGGECKTHEKEPSSTSEPAQAPEEHPSVVTETALPTGECHGDDCKNIEEGLSAATESGITEREPSGSTESAVSTEIPTSICHGDNCDNVDKSVTESGTPERESISPTEPAVITEIPAGECHGDECKTFNNEPSAVTESESFGKATEPAESMQTLEGESPSATETAHAENIPASQCTGDQCKAVDSEHLPSTEQSVILEKELTTTFKPSTFEEIPNIQAPSETKPEQDKIVPTEASETINASDNEPPLTTESPSPPETDTEPSITEPSLPAETPEKSQVVTETSQTTESSFGGEEIQMTETYVSKLPEPSQAEVSENVSYTTTGTEIIDEEIEKEVKTTAQSPAFVDSLDKQSTTSKPTVFAKIPEKEETSATESSKPAEEEEKESSATESLKPAEEGEKESSATESSKPAEEDEKESPTTESSKPAEEEEKESPATESSKPAEQEEKESSTTESSKPTEKEEKESSTTESSKPTEEEEKESSVTESLKPAEEEEKVSSATESSEPAEEEEKESPATESSKPAEEVEKESSATESSKPAEEEEKESPTTESSKPAEGEEKESSAPKQPEIECNGDNCIDVGKEPTGSDTHTTPENKFPAATESPKISEASEKAPTPSTESAIATESTAECSGYDCKAVDKDSITTTEASTITKLPDKQSPTQESQDIEKQSTGVTELAATASECIGNACKTTEKETSATELPLYTVVSEQEVGIRETTVPSETSESVSPAVTVPELPASNDCIGNDCRVLDLEPIVDTNATSSTDQPKFEPSPVSDSTERPIYECTGHDCKYDENEISSTTESLVAAQPSSCIGEECFAQKPQIPTEEKPSTECKGEECKTTDRVTTDTSISSNVTPKGDECTDQGCHSVPSESKCSGDQCKTVESNEPTPSETSSSTAPTKLSETSCIGEECKSIENSPATKEPTTDLEEECEHGNCRRKQTSEASSETTSLKPDNIVEQEVTSQTESTVLESVTKPIEVFVPEDKDTSTATTKVEVTTEKMSQDTSSIPETENKEVTAITERQSESTTQSQSPDGLSSTLLPEVYPTEKLPADKEKEFESSTEIGLREHTTESPTIGQEPHKPIETETEAPEKQSAITESEESSSLFTNAPVTSLGEVPEKSTSSVPQEIEKTTESVKESPEDTEKQHAVTVIEVSATPIVKEEEQFSTTIASDIGETDNKKKPDYHDIEPEKTENVQTEATITEKPSEKTTLGEEAIVTYAATEPAPEQSFTDKSGVSETDIPLATETPTASTPSSPVTPETEKEQKTTERPDKEFTLQVISTTVASMPESESAKPTDKLEPEYPTRVPESTDFTTKSNEQTTISSTAAEELLTHSQTESTATELNNLQTAVPEIVTNAPESIPTESQVRITESPQHAEGETVAISTMSEKKPQTDIYVSSSTILPESKPQSSSASTEMQKTTALEENIATTEGFEEKSTERIPEKQEEHSTSQQPEIVTETAITSQPDIYSLATTLAIADETVSKSEEPVTQIKEQETSTESKVASETTPYQVELELHTHKTPEETSSPSDFEATTAYVLTEQSKEPESTSAQDEDQTMPNEMKTTLRTGAPIEEQTEKMSSAVPQTTAQPAVTEAKETDTPVFQTTPAYIGETDNRYGSGISEKSTEIPEIQQTEKHVEPELTTRPSLLEESPVTEKASTEKTEETPVLTTTLSEKAEEKPQETSTSKPVEMPQEETSEEDGHFPSAPGYGQEPDYVEEDQAFGPGTCRYGGKVYVSAQQIPRDDPCDFCFCFRSDIICLQQSCPPPIHGCREEPIQGFCCPRYECPVSMATTLNVTTTTTTTTTTLPPHFLPHAYKGAAQRKGCVIKGHTYKVGEVVRASSGPCLHCTCGGDGQMKCDPKVCTPEPMLRQMIAAAVSSKRRR